MKGLEDQFGGEMRFKGLEGEARKRPTAGIVVLVRRTAYLSDVTGIVEQCWFNGRGTGFLIHAVS